VECELAELAVEKQFRDVAWLVHGGGGSLSDFLSTNFSGNRPIRE